MYKKEVRYMELMPEGLSTKHFNYHLQQLICKEIIFKGDQYYDLTDKGKNLVSKMSDDASEVEESPKITVWLYVRRKKGRSFEYLATRRTKQPYYGKIGWVCGKPLFGETFEEAAKRELYEETGLTANFKMSHMYHKIRYNEKGDYVQDALFVIFIGDNPTGELNPSKEGELFWITKTKLLQSKQLFDDVLGDFDVMERNKFCFVENVKIVESEF